jgi:MOSC domain-containing protein YiiM
MKTRGAVLFALFVAIVRRSRARWGRRHARGAVVHPVEHGRAEFARMNSLPLVVSAHLSPVHGFSKSAQLGIRLLAGLGVEGDAHCGATVQHRHDKRRNPRSPNLRQVHLIQGELLDELQAEGFRVLPGDLGENLSTRGVDLTALPTGTRLRIGDEAVVELTGLRSPCVYIDRYQPGLLARMRAKPPGAPFSVRAGVMAVVVHGGHVGAGDSIAVAHPPLPWQALKPV